MEVYWRSPPCSPNLGLDPLRVTDIKSRTDIGMHPSWDGALRASRRLVLFYRFALRTIIYGVRLPSSIVGRRTAPSDTPSPPPYLAHPWPPAYLPRFILAPRFPAP